MDRSLNMNNGGRQFELHIPIIDPSTFESPSSYTDSGPTRTRKLRLHSTTPYSRNNNNNIHPTQSDNTWFSTLISLIPSFMSKLLGFTGETASPRLNENEMDIDRQQHDGPNGVQERFVQSNRIFTEPINNTNGLFLGRSETTQNNAIKRKRPEENLIEIEEEKLRRQAQIEDQNHKPDLKELFYKEIDPNWYKPFKNNPDNYPKFASSSRVTSDTYGPDPNLNLPKESPPLKKFKPSVIPTPRWFDYYPDKDEDMIDRRRTENIVEKRKVEEKVLEKEKASHKSKKGKGKTIDTNLANGKEKPGGTISNSQIHISPLKDQNYFANIQTPTVASSSTMNTTPIGTIENQSQSAIVDPSKTSGTTEDKGSTIQKNQSQTSLPNDDTLVDGSTPLVVSKNDKEQVHTSLSIGPTKDVEEEVPLSEVPLSEVPLIAPLTEAPLTEAPLTEAPLTEAPLTEAPQNAAPSTSITTDQEDTVGVNNVSSSHETNKDQSSSSMSFSPSTLNNGATSNNIFDPSSPFSNIISKTSAIAIPSNNIREAGNSTDSEKERREGTEIPTTQQQTNPFSDFRLKINGQGAVTTGPSLFAIGSSTTDNKATPFGSSFASTPVSTTVSTFSFGPTTTQSNNIGSLFSGTIFSNSDNNIGKSEKSDKSVKHRPYGSSSSFRNKRNKRTYGASGIGTGLENERNVLTNPKTATSDQSSTRLLISVPGTFDFNLSSNPSPATPSLLSAGNENTPFQPIFNLTSINGGTQPQQTTSTAPIFGTSVTSNPPLFGANQTLTAASTFQTSNSNTGSVNLTPMFGGNSTSANFGFGINATTSAPIGFGTGLNPPSATAAGFVTNSIPSGNFFGPSQNSTAATGFGLATPNFNNQIIQNGRPNNLFQAPNMGNITNNFPQQNQQQAAQVPNFNFGVSNGQGFTNSNPSLGGGGSDLSKVAGRKIRNVRRRGR